MNDSYDVFLSGQTAGKARVRKEGLYLCISCRCQLSGEVVYQLEVEGEGQWLKLGIPVPADGEFILETRIPRKRLPEGEFRFRLTPRHTEKSGIFIPISPEEPFRYLTRLQNAVMEIRDGKKGILLRN